VSAALSGGIFISYRRQESSHLAGRLYDRLAERFGEERVFMDVATIDLGVDFAEVITRASATIYAATRRLGRGQAHRAGCWLVPLPVRVRG